MNKQKILLYLLLVYTAISRIYFAYDLPLSGDEVGVGVLQATGQAINYADTTFSQVVSIDEIKKYIDYSEDYGIEDTLLSLRDRVAMHPPFYYVVLHYVIKYFGNDILVLRSLSIIFSLLSIIVISQLGKKIFCQSAGLCSALLFATSPYCLQYNVMVRPYPLLTLLSLLSTLQIYSLIKKESFNYSNIYLYLYILTAVIGLYTMYHFIFIIFFQWAFVFLASPKTWNSISKNLSVFVLILILFLPWIPYLQDQLKVVNSGGYYFHGEYELFSIIRSTLYECSFGPIHLLLDGNIIRIIKIVIAFVFCVQFLAGCIYTFNNRINRLLVISLGFYLLSHFAADWMLQSKTLGFAKFRFFLVPVFLLFTSCGIFCTTKRFYTKLFSVLLLCFILMLGSIVVCKTKSNFDGPHISPLRKLIRENSRDNDKKLFIINSRSRRQMFTFAHAVNGPGDLVIIPGNKTISELVEINNIEKYGCIYIVGMFDKGRGKSVFADMRQQFINAVLKKYNSINKKHLLFKNGEITSICLH